MKRNGTGVKFCFRSLVGASWKGRELRNDTRFVICNRDRQIEMRLSEGTAGSRRGERSSASCAETGNGSVTFDLGSPGSDQERGARLFATRQPEGGSNWAKSSPSFAARGWANNGKRGDHMRD